MIISPGRKLVFVHIPKTGGTSMALALEARAMKDDILIGDTPKARRRKRRVDALPARGRLWKHARLKDLDGYLGPDDLADFFVFTLVRNPWDRMVSYYHWLREQSFDHRAVSLAKSTDFTGFLLDRRMQAALSRDCAAEYVRDAAGDVRCNVFVRLECLEEDMVPLAAHLGFTPEVSHVNSSTRRADYRTYYSEDTVERIAHLFADDIARFGYRY